MKPEDQLRQAITQRVEAFAEEKGYAFSAAKEAIIRDMARMHQRFGDFYCPCQLENSPATVCICEAVKKGLVELEGACFCHFFLKQPEE